MTCRPTRWLSSLPAFTTICCGSGQRCSYVRRVLFWMHLSAGVLISLLVIFFSVTGALLAYERPIVRVADEHSYRVDPSRPRIRLPLDALIAPAIVGLPAPVEMVTTHQDPHLPVELETANRGVYFIDPYSRKVTGPESPRLRGFFRPGHGPASLVR